MAEKDEHATLNYPGGELELDVVEATEGSDGIALGSLLSKTGYTTYDDGFVNTASTKSAITYIDGDAGILRYRCLLYTSPSPRDGLLSRMPSSA